MPAPVADLVSQMLQGDKLALSRLITIVERDGQETPDIMRSVHPHAGRAYTVGVTGPPGAGKSTLVDELVRQARADGNQQVGVIAVDPTSPFTGGAILGDRIRMQRHFEDPGVFIRSMATRGSLGGLPRTARRVAKLLSAFGEGLVFIETVGVGQAELDIMGASDTVVVILVPEGGDAIQAMKAGLMEIADIFVVNKADRDGAEALVKEVKLALHMGQARSAWEAPVLTTQAHKGVGIAEVYQQVKAHRAHLESTGGLEQRRRTRRKAEFMDTIEEQLSARLQQLIAANGALGQSLARIEFGDLDPYSAAADVLKDRHLLHTWLSTLEGE